MCDFEMGCTEEICCLTSAPAAIPAMSACKIGDAITATWQQDGRQYRGEIATLNADSTITVSWLDGDTTYPVVAAEKVFKNGLPCSGSGAAAASLLITSDGTAARPHCSWQASCQWEQGTKDMCAAKLCEASGYSRGRFLAASNNMCTTSFTASPFHYFSVDTSQFTSTSTGDGNEAAITAKCQEKVVTGQMPPLGGGVLPLAGAGLGGPMVPPMAGAGLGGPMVPPMVPPISPTMGSMWAKHPPTMA